MKKLFTILLFLFAGTTISLAQVNLSNRLLAHYPFESNANDIASDPAHGIVSGAVLTTNRNGEGSSAYMFPTNADRITAFATNKFNLSGMDSFSFSVWIKPSALRILDARILSFSDNASSLELNYLCPANGIDSGKIEILNYNSAMQQIEVKLFSDSMPQKGQWIHLAALFTKNPGTAKLYMNGRLAAQISHVLALPANAMFVIGNVSVNNWGFDGSIDDVRIYNRLLTQDEINELADIVTTGVQQNDKAVSFSIYPNPGTGVFTINADNKERFQSIHLFNALGQQVYESEFSHQIDLSNLEKGVYFVQLKAEEGETITNNRLIIR